jgi:serine/threonine protein kinase
LTDFGLSKEKVAGLNGTKSFCGSIAFMAPEVIRRSGHGHTVDIYGLGVLLYCMLVGMPPFYDRRKETLIANIKRAELRIPSSVPPKAASFVKATMQRDPKDRLGAVRSDDCQDHEWFNSTMDFAALMRREVPLPEPFENLLPSNGGGVAIDGSTPTVNANFGKLAKATARGKNQDVEGWNFASPFHDDTSVAIPPRERKNRSNSL